VWPLLVELVDEAVELALLLEKILRRRVGSFFLQRQVHALVAPVLLGVRGFDALDADSQPQPTTNSNRRMRRSLLVSRLNVAVTLLPKSSS
jgi:hypothetical protein